MASLWPYGPVNFTVNGGERSALEFAVPRRGTVRSVIVEQVDGSDSGTLQLFDSRDAAVAYLGEGESSVSESGEAPASAVAHAVTPELVIAGGVLVENDLRAAYVNRDGTNAQPVRRLWGILDVPDSVGRVTFAVSLTIEQVQHCG